MRTLVISALAAIGAQVAMAQTAPPAAPPPVDPAKIEAEKANVAKHTCGPTPEWPGKRASDNQKRAYERSIKTFGDCVKLYLEERHVTIKANEAVAKALIEEYNESLNKARADSKSN